MKEYKLLVLGTLVSLFALYFITYSASENDPNYKSLSEEEQVFFFTELNDEEKEGIALTPLDSIKPEYFENQDTYKRITSTEAETYKVFQNIFLESLEIEQNLHFYRRLILILCLILSSYILFSKKYKYNMTFQKAMFHNAVFSLIFSLFCIFSFVTTQTIRGTSVAPSIMFQFGLGHFISVLKSTLFWFVAVSFFIYFNPQNIDWYQRRMAKKKAKENKD
ncbi:MAG: hypothetical protein CMP67_10525 [Flavobacteriales bacterium]|nr:hypothetical protein [Flavobacteriales bacterium]MBO73546.1 hypothetical protein [Flavobacteriales bacterium]|tara:strand:+ start:10879 stop:11541 length:663 start_codon:yes stop_codon:yes gene_type:complete